MQTQRFNDLKKRAITSFMSIVAITCLLFFAFNPIVSPIVVVIFCLITGAAAWEYAVLAESKNYFIKKSLFAVGAICLVLSFFFSARYYTLGLLPLVIFFLFSILLFLMNFKKIEGAFANVSISVFGLLYVAVPLGMLLFILYYPYSYKLQDGRWWVVYLLVITKITDVAAYFGGRCFGSHKLASNLSPKKTIEGAFFGFIFAILSSIGFSLLSQNYLIGEFNLSMKMSLLLGAILGIVGQFGDLAESLIKRDAQVKDSSKIPGLGGVLDMVDSLLFTIPVLYFFLMR